MELNKTFTNGLWNKEINVSDFVSKNIAPYTGDASFLQGPTERTKRIWDICLKALEEERNNNGVRSLDNTTVSTITSHKAGYIDKDNELIVGLQTDELLKRSIKPFGGINVVAKACRENGVEVDDKVKDIFTHYRKTHNDGVFDVYTEEIRSFRSLGFLTGLARQLCPRTYHRRLPPIWLSTASTVLIEAKQEDLRNLTGPDDRSTHPSTRRSGGTNQSFEGHQGYGRILRTRPQPSGYISSRGCAMGIHGISCCHQRAGRSSHVTG